ncbi:MAG: hypothetical protein AW07_04113 [Candidatus Accumulibacter sp. SK-11]|nr:MAG: hypothetical protein AW07_04113 [Candidatus Accumulibacter sp. SK-11]
MAGDQWPSGEARLGRCPRAVHSGLCTNGGEQLSPLDAVGGARFVDAQHGAASIAIVVQRQADQALKLRVGEVITPANGRRACTSLSGRRRIDG